MFPSRASMATTTVIKRGTRLLSGITEMTAAPNADHVENLRGKVGWGGTFITGHGFESAMRSIPMRCSNELQLRLVSKLDPKQFNGPMGWVQESYQAVKDLYRSLRPDSRGILGLQGLGFTP